MPVLCMQDMYGAINKMKDPSFIRVESDEVTYPMHILLRYEIEKGLLLGEIEVDDVPKVWNEKMETYLGCAPADDAQARPRISHASLTHLSRISHIAGVECHRAAHACAARVPGVTAGPVCVHTG